MKFKPLDIIQSSSYPESGYCLIIMLIDYYYKISYPGSGYPNSTNSLNFKYAESNYILITNIFSDTQE